MMDVNKKPQKWYTVRISQPIRCTVIFSLEILEKNNDERILVLVIYVGRSSSKVS
jgi:hypothetical protein